MNNFSAAIGDSKGEINLQWDSVDNAVSYKIEIAKLNTAKDPKWKIIDIITDPRYTVKKLKSHKKYYFRIESINEDGRAKLSKKIIKKAP